MYFLGGCKLQYQEGEGTTLGYTANLLCDVGQTACPCSPRVDLCKPVWRDLSPQPLTWEVRITCGIWQLWLVDEIPVGCVALTRAAT